MTADEPTPNGADLAAVVRACDERLNPSDQWAPFEGYPASLALCVLDAIWSINVRYVVTRGVITRYRNARRWQGNPDEDGLPELFGVYERLGGVDTFVEQIGTRNRVSTRPDAMRKAEAVFVAATALHHVSIDTADQFRSASGTPLGDQAKKVWLAVPGQGSGISWRYLRMLLGLPDVKPDRMVIRFLASALGVDESAIDADRAVVLVQATAAHLGVEQQALDHEIWEYQSGKRSGHDPISEKDVLAQLAESFIGVAFPALAEDHIIPTSRSFPYAHLARDYFGGDVSGPEEAEFEAMLQVVYPERFVDPLKREHAEFPSFYIFPVLEAAITRCARAGDDAYETNTPEVQESITELISVLDAPEYTMTCCRAMSHLTTKDEQPVTIGDITIYPESDRDGLLKRTRDLVPMALSAMNREQPFYYDPPHSLIVTTTTADDPNRFGMATRLAQRIERFLLLARLLYAGTHESAWQVAGVSTLVGWPHPMYRPFAKSSMPNILMQRVIAFSTEDAIAIAALNALLEAAVVKRDKMVATSFDIALSNYTRSHEEGDHYERIVDLATALEAILTGSDDDSEGIGLRLRTRAAALLWTDSDPGSAIFNDVKTLYNLRSKLVHGARIATKDLLKWLHAVSTVPDDATYGTAFAFAVDRLRDLVRRCFLARLCLASGDNPLWKFETSAPVDAALSDATERERWRQSWRDVLASLGVPTAADPAVRAVDPLAGPDAVQVEDGTIVESPEHTGAL
jgi:hypothetical protein